MANPKIILLAGSSSLLVIIVSFVIAWVLGAFTPSVDCEVSQWGACDHTTGKRTRKITKQKEGNGKDCGALEEDCPVDCSTSVWGPCVNDMQKRTVVTPAKNGGKECGALEQSCFAPFSAGENLNTDGQEYYGLYYLDRQPKMCQDKPINGFKLDKTTDGKFKLNYKCADNLYGGAKISKMSKNLDTHLISGLSRTPIECGSNQVLSNYGLVNDNGYKFKYDCIESKSDLTCRELSTPKDSNILNHNIQCNNDEVLGSMKVIDHGYDIVNYVYNCCKKVVPK